MPIILGLSKYRHIETICQSEKITNIGGALAPPTHTASSSQRSGGLAIFGKEKLNPSTKINKNLQINSIQFKNVYFWYFISFTIYHNCEIRQYMVSRIIFDYCTDNVGIIK